MDGLDRILTGIIDDLDYSVDWKATALRPGRHRSRVRGSGFEFKDVVSMLDADKLMRIDPVATSQSIDRIPKVRVVEQKSTVKIILVADLSASLSYSGFISKREEMAKFAAILGYSAYRTGDSFGYLGYSDKIEFSVAPVYSKGAGFDAARIIWEHPMKGCGHSAAIQASELLPKEKSVVFWFTDFNFSDGDTEKVLLSLYNYDVRAVSFIDRSEIDLPGFGFTAVRDPESGVIKQVFSRKSVREKVRKMFFEKQKKLELLFGSYGCDIYFNVDCIDKDKIQDWLLA